MVIKKVVSSSNYRAIEKKTNDSIFVESPKIDYRKKLNSYSLDEEIENKSRRAFLNEY